jgi:hypothetical protein
LPSGASFSLRSTVPAFAANPIGPRIALTKSMKPLRWIFSVTGRSTNRAALLQGCSILLQPPRCAILFFEGLGAGTGFHAVARARRWRSNAGKLRTQCEAV